MKAFLVIAALLSPRISDACSISIASARILRSTAGDTAGTRPFIFVSVKGAEVTSVLSGNCPGLCKGTPVAVEAVGSYLRPKAPLAEGTKLQVSKSGKLLDAAVIGAPSKLPAWDGIEWVSAKQEPVGKCTPAGPVVQLRLKPTKAAMADAYLLVYAARPDDLGTPIQIQPLENYAKTELELRNGYGGELFRTLPKQLFVRLADGNGNLGPVIKLP